MTSQSEYRARAQQARARARAFELVESGLALQSQDRWADAIQCYRKSLEAFPTAEAYTFLGWVYSLLGLHETAISLCHQAIDVDPTLGNPYNDIGAYLLELGRPTEAIPWLEQALLAERYENRCFACYNLGRAYERLGKWRRALRYYRDAIDEDPQYVAAERARQTLLSRVN